jgi:hypothetical protein
MAAAIVEARNFFGILKVSYEVVSGLPLTSLDATRKIQTKSHLLLLLHTLLEPLPPSDREWKLEMMDEHGENEGSDTLVNTGICHDYNVLFAQQDGQAAIDLSSGESGKQAIGEKQMDALRSLSSGMKLHTHREDESVMIKVSADVRLNYWADSYWGVLNLITIMLSHSTGLRPSSFSSPTCLPSCYTKLCVILGSLITKARTAAKMIR